MSLRRPTGRWGLRDYGVGGQLGLEKTPEEFISKLVEIFREVRRVLRNDGTCWVNLGDSYAGSGKGSNADGTPHPAKLTGKQGTNKGTIDGLHYPQKASEIGLKPKDLVGIPWRFALAAQADGWYLRQDIIWCLSGGTWVYARTQKGEMPVMIRDLYRLKPNTVRLWNGKEWTPLLGISRSKRSGDEIEIVLRSGERISCTKTHRFPSSRGLVEAGKLQKGDRLFFCKLPDVINPKDSLQIGVDAAWLAGLYIAEGSRSEDTIQIAGHSKEASRWERIQGIAREYGGSATRTISGNKMDIRIYGKILNGIIDQFVSGKTAKDKCFSPCVWKYSNNFIESLIRGYLEGDGHWDEKNHRWRLGFCRNYNLERDLRTACSRLGYKLILNMSTSSCNGKKFPSFKGEIRMTYDSYRTQKDPGEIVEIRKARCREIYDLGVMDEPHEFALASGILTHNSKPNPMPESVTDRCTKSHEYIFLLTKSARYWYDAEAIKEDIADGTEARMLRGVSDKHKNINGAPGQPPHSMNQPRENRRGFITQPEETGLAPSRHGQNIETGGKRNKRSVWTISTQAYSEAHFAAFPEKLVEPCILAGCPKEVCPKCGKARVRIVEKSNTPDLTAKGSRFDSGKTGDRDGGNRTQVGERFVNQSVGWSDCGCNAGFVPGIVLDPFIGSGTTGLVALKNERSFLGIELNPKYIGMAYRRIVTGLEKHLYGKPKKPKKEAAL